MQSLLSRVGKGAGAILCGQAIITVGNVARVPLYLERWAPTVYGEWVALWTLPFPTWVGLAETRATEAKWVIWLTGTYSLVAMPAGLISSFYRTTGDLPRSQWMGNIQQVLLLSLVATVLVVGGGTIALAAWQLLPLLAMTGF